jgi:hypothetical protein
MSTGIDPESLKRLLAELDARIESLRTLHGLTEETLRDLFNDLNAVTKHRQRVQAVLDAVQAVATSAAGKSLPKSDPYIDDEETMYLGASPEESLRGGGTAEPTF